MALPRSAGEPRIGLVTWHRAPRRRPLIVALATDRQDRQDWLAIVFGAEVRLPETSAGAAPLVDASVVDSPAVLKHRAVAPLLAAPTVVLWADDGTERALALLRAGADALLPFDISAPALRVAVCCVLRGEAVVSPAVASAVARRVRESERLT